MKKALQVVSAALVLVLILSMNVSALADEAEYRTTQLFLNKLETVEGAEYSVIGVEETDSGSEYERIKITYQGNLSDYRSTLYMDFAEDGDEVMLYLFRLISFNEENLQEVLRELNSLNAKFKGVKFYVDETNCDVTAELYLPTTEKTIEELSLFGFEFMIGIAASAYESLAEYAE